MLPLGGRGLPRRRRSWGISARYDGHRRRLNGGRNCVGIRSESGRHGGHRRRGRHDAHGRRGHDGQRLSAGTRDVDRARTVRDVLRDRRSRRRRSDGIDVGGCRSDRRTADGFAGVGDGLDDCAEGLIGRAAQVRDGVIRSDPGHHGAHDRNLGHQIDDRRGDRLDDATRDDLCNRLHDRLGYLADGLHDDGDRLGDRRGSDLDGRLRDSADGAADDVDGARDCVRRGVDDAHHGTQKTRAIAIVLGGVCGTRRPASEMTIQASARKQPASARRSVLDSVECVASTFTS